MSKIMSVLTTAAGITAKARRTINHSPQFSGVQRGENGRPDTQVPAGGFLTG
ncbi:hypothetical protein [Natronococcus wangiae]|uniref:hypothetical protein n=1 Tax=Natronococcus wangiae TaxID=3068275 RepID=UPI00273DC323|nr:hypothetical protein [Natronococcus sp. AD5]